MKKLPEQNYSKFGELQKIVKENKSLDIPLAVIEKHFNTKQITVFFNVVKEKGISAIYLFNILVIMPFLGFATVLALCENKKKNDVEGEKDSYYNLKNSSLFAWRCLQYMVVKRFLFLVKPQKELSKYQAITAFMVDDSDLKKYGKKIEKVSKVWDHVHGISILGFKLLVFGYWDGTGFIPLDFSLHREEGRAYSQIKKHLRKSNKSLTKLYVSRNELVIQIEASKSELKKYKKVNTKSAEKAKEKHKQKKCEKQNLLKKNNIAIQNQKNEIKKIQKELEGTHRYGLTKKELSAQYKQVGIEGTPAAQRHAECDMKKTDNTIRMLKRAVKHGIIASYLLADSWFFNYALVKATREVTGNKTHYVGMAAMGKQKYLIDNKEYSPRELVKMNKDRQQSCRKLNAKYIRLQTQLIDIDVNMFFVKLSKRDRWKLLVTTNLKLTFLEIMEIYQIRWSIEVFFKECKQYLQLGKCQSNSFNAQIADTTLTMIRYILLSFYKRIHYQTSIGGIFQIVSHQTVELSLAEKLWGLFLELQQVVSKIIDLDLYQLFMQALNNPIAEEKIIEILDLFKPDKNLEINEKIAA